MHPNPGPRISGQDGIGTLNVGGPHILERRWNGLLQELSSTGLKVIALQELRFHKGAESRGPKTEQVVRNYKLFTGRPLGSGSDECFLVHESWAIYARLISGPAHLGVVIKVRGTGEVEWVICNIHGKHARPEKQKAG